MYWILCLEMTRAREGRHLAGVVPNVIFTAGTEALVAIPAAERVLIRMDLVAAMAEVAEVVAIDRVPARMRWVSMVTPAPIPELRKSCFSPTSLKQQELTSTRYFTLRWFAINFVLNENFAALLALLV